MTRKQELREYFAKSTNPAIVFSKILAGHHSRVSIAKASGLDRASVTRCVAGLADLGLVTESDLTQKGGLGRPRRSLELLNEENWIVAIHIGYHTVAVGAVGIGGVVLNRTVKKHDRSVASVLQVCLAGIQFHTRQQNCPPLGISVTVGGRVSTQSQIILSMPEFGWQDVDLRTPLKEATGLPVVLSPTALAHAQANLLYGLVGSDDTFGHLYIGSIVEYALIQKGESWSGSGIASGILENLPVKTLSGSYGTVRELVSDEGVTALAQQRGLLPKSADFEDLLMLTGEDARLPKPSAQVAGLQEILDWRAQNVATLIQQLNEVVPVPKVVLSASIIRQPEGMEVVQKTIGEYWRDSQPPQILSGGELSRGGMLAPTAAFLAKLIG
ncbi:hypothetical protein BSR29_00955 [Boudabousia liubingyangii]|uniref:ROK family transcriptional regulator n=1 Tax=Boudabousia liubingyangii TaxID=1921764 RepID=A0A1Q5PPU7_9ACTO|nr:ROK family protein [Boudabousia liubingyangii]OKL49557.1 hypothetical protein BSR29_00955 [Boudabousia liubingyangii]